MKDIPAIKTFQWVRDLDVEFCNYLGPELQVVLDDYRVNYDRWSAGDLSKFLLDFGVILEDFIVAKFKLEAEVAFQKNQSLIQHPILSFKRNLVQKVLKKPDLQGLADFFQLHEWLLGEINTVVDDFELAVAKLYLQLVVRQDSTGLDKLAAWVKYVMHDEQHKQLVFGWVSFKFPEKIDCNNLVDVKLDSPGSYAFAQNYRFRQGFGLTDNGMSLRELQDQADYCIYCHKNQGDFCSRGFPVKKSQPELGLKHNSFGDILTGCPLDEKISEMQFLYSKGHNIAALAVIMVDNPLCPATGHRVCNDCMKACIYQKQTPVNIPQIETGVLNSVLDLAYGVELYDLLLNWNPLRAVNHSIADDNDRNVVVMGMGPAGFTMANQLLMLGYSVVGLDGLKIEPLFVNKYNSLIEDFQQISNCLDARLVLGFGGVAEYGITSRWNKNYLSLILIVLLRRQRFRLFGGIRFGGTVTVDDIWRLGADHLVLAVGAGLPREINIPGSLAPGVRVANDFLMALQLSGAHKFESLTGLEVDLPAVVIGGGLTGIDAATEVQAYYLLQIAKVAKRYKDLVLVFGEAKLRDKFTASQLLRLDRWLRHAEELELERQQPDSNIVKLLHIWGGVTVVYRKTMQDSPAYKRNHEELIKALEEGVLYAPCFAPTAVVVDADGRAKALTVVKTQLVEDSWEVTEETANFPARTVLLATGAQPNVAYGFEHAGVFARKRYQYIEHKWQAGELVPAAPALHNKSKDIGVFTSYLNNNKCVSFIGDTHPTFHGSVVKAVASAMYAAPLVDQAVSRLPVRASNDFLRNCEVNFQAKVVNKIRLNSNKILLVIYAPMLVAKWLPGQFVRLQTYESFVGEFAGLSLHSEAVHAVVFGVDVVANTFQVVLSQDAVSEKLIARLVIGDSISVMGPTGVKAKMFVEKNSVLLFVDLDLIANVLALLPTLKELGHFVILVVRIEAEGLLILQEELEKYADKIFWQVEIDSELLVRKQDCKVIDAMLWETIFAWLQVNIVVAEKLVDVRLLVKADRLPEIKENLSAIVAVTGVPLQHCVAAVYGPMQCMLKGVCAQCLQWQIDPITGERTKAVYACSWQDQPVELIDLQHLQLRQINSGILEQINNLILSDKS